MGGSCQACEWFWAIHRDEVSKSQPVETTWSLHGPRGSKALARVLQRGLVESGDSPIPQQNIAAFFLLMRSLSRSSRRRILIFITCQRTADNLLQATITSAT